MGLNSLWGDKGLFTLPHVYVSLTPTAGDLIQALDFTEEGQRLRVGIACPRTLGCWGAELIEISGVLTSGPGLVGFGSVQNCFTCR